METIKVRSAWLQCVDNIARKENVQKIKMWTVFAEYFIGIVSIKHRSIAGTIFGEIGVRTLSEF